jgi:hypothetical protein
MVFKNDTGVSEYMDTAENFYNRESLVIQSAREFYNALCQLYGYDNKEQSATQIATLFHWWKNKPVSSSDYSRSMSRCSIVKSAVISDPFKDLLEHHS